MLIKILTRVFKSFRFEIISVLLSVSLTFFVFFILESEKRENDLKTFIQSVNHFEKVGQIFIDQVGKEPDASSQNLLRNLNTLRNKYFWNPTSLSWEDNYGYIYPQVLDEQGRDIETGKYSERVVVHLYGVDKPTLIQKENQWLYLVLPFSHGGKLYFFIMPMPLKFLIKITEKPDLGLAKITNRYLFSTKNILPGILQHSWFIGFLMVLVFGLVCAARYFFEKPRRLKTIKKYQGKLRILQSLRKDNKDLKLNLYELRDNLNNTKKAVLSYAKEYMDTSEKVTKLVEDIDLKLLRPSSRYPSGLIIFDIFRKEQAALSDIVKDCLDLFKDSLNSRGIIVTLGNQTTKRVVYSDHRLIFSTLCLALEELLASRPLSHHPLILRWEIKDEKVVFYFQGKFENCVKLPGSLIFVEFNQGDGGTEIYKAVIPTFGLKKENKKTLKHQDQSYKGSENVISLFKS